MGEAIVGGIFSAYLWVAGISFLLALVVPRSRSSKTFAVIVVSVIFGAIPAWLTVSYQQSKAKEKAENIASAQECERKEYVPPPKPLDPVAGYFADPAYFLIDDEKITSLEDMVGMLVSRRMTFFETVNPAFAISTRKLPPGQPNTKKPYVRLYLEKADHDNCRWFHTWSNQYPAQRLPPLRRAGLTSDYCVGLEEVSELRSRFQIRYNSQPFQGLSNNYGKYKFDLKLNESKGADALARLSGLHYVGTGYKRPILCEQNAQLQSFQTLITIAPDPRYVTKVKVVEQEPSRESMPEVNAIPNSAFKRYTWQGEGKGLNNSTNIVSYDANTWVESNYVQRDDRTGTNISLAGYSLVVIAGNTLYRSAKIASSDVSGLGVSADGFALIVGMYKLYEFNKRAALVRISLLSDDQLRDVGLKK